ncbi:MAG: cohesin domain-containing protein, partial [bacterium]
GIGSVEGEFCWCPIKGDSCDTVGVTFYVKSTMPDSLMDTLAVTLIVENTFIHTFFPDTTYYPCGWMETFFYIDPNYVDCIDTLGILSLDVVLSYDPNCLHVTEVGHVGLITEFWGTITYNIVDGNIFVSLSGNDTLRWCDTTVTQQDSVALFYVGFTVDADAVPGDTCWLCIEHVKVNEGWPPAYWDECTEIGCAAIVIKCLSISGNVSYCSTLVAVPNVEMKMSGYAVDTVLTDSNGNYEFPCVYACGDYCIKPQKEWLPPQVVNSFDGSMIMRSLVGLETLGSCQQIAADVSGDGTITGYDAALLLRWRVGYTVPGHVGEWKFGADSLCYDGLTWDMPNQDYWSIVIGDVSLNWPGDGPPKLRAEADSATIDLAPPVASPGQNFTLPICLGKVQPIYSADLSLKYDPQILTAIEAWPTELTADFVTAYRLTDGEIRVALAGANPVQSGGPITRIGFEVSEEVPEGASSPFELTVTLNEDYTLTRSEAFTAQNPVPREYGLAQNYPNPFNPSTTIRYQIPIRGRGTKDEGRPSAFDPRPSTLVSLRIYNILGQEVRTLVDEPKEPGYYSVVWDGRDERGDEVASG